MNDLILKEVKELVKSLERIENTLDHILEILREK